MRQFTARARTPTQTRERWHHPRPLPGSAQLRISAISATCFGQQRPVRPPAGFPLIPLTAPFPAARSSSTIATQGPPRSLCRRRHRGKSLARNAAKSLTPTSQRRRSSPSIGTIRLRPVAMVRARPSAGAPASVLANRFASSVQRLASAARTDRTAPSPYRNRCGNCRRCPNAFHPIHRAVASCADHPRACANRHQPSADVYAGCTGASGTSTRRARPIRRSHQLGVGEAPLYRLRVPHAPPARGHDAQADDSRPRQRSPLATPAGTAGPTHRSATTARLRIRRRVSDDEPGPAHP